MSDPTFPTRITSRPGSHERHRVLGEFVATRAATPAQVAANAVALAQSNADLDALIAARLS